LAIAGMKPRRSAPLEIHRPVHSFPFIVMIGGHQGLSRGIASHAAMESSRML
jgi:hypothetical protein